MNINKSSDWNRSEIHQFLLSSKIPIRIATVTTDFPTLCSVWYLFDPEREELVCATHEKSQLALELLANNKCAFEVSPNDPPYMGVRGKAEVTLSRENVHDTLTSLIERYLDNTESGLAKWLLGRADEEYILRLKPARLTSWDYSKRMSK